MPLALSPQHGSAGDIVEVATPGGNTPTRCELLELDQPFVAPTTFSADNVRSPNAPWAVPASAVLAADTVNGFIQVRRFAAAAELGIGFDVEIPVGATGMFLAMVWRAQVAPVAPVGVQPRLYWRQIENNASLPAWSPPLALDVLAVPPNTNWQYSSQAIALSTLGVTPGLHTFFELTRAPLEPSDTLVGAWNLYRLGVILI